MNQNKQETQQKPFYKKWWFIVAVAIVVIGMIGQRLEDKEEGTVATEEPKTTVEQAKVEEVPAEPPFDFVNAELNEENVKKALANVKGTSVINLNEESFRDMSNTIGLLVIRINSGDFWDTKDLARRAAATLTAYSEVLFTHPDVNDVVIDVHTEFTDIAGNKEEKTAIRVGWTKEIASQINYENFKQLVVTEPARVYILADRADLHQSIREELKDDEDFVGVFN